MRNPVLEGLQHLSRAKIIELNQNHLKVNENKAFLVFLCRRKDYNGMSGHEEV